MLRWDEAEGGGAGMTAAGSWLVGAEVGLAGAEADVGPMYTGGRVSFAWGAKVVGCDAQPKLEATASRRKDVRLMVKVLGPNVPVGSGPRG